MTRVKDLSLQAYTSPVINKKPPPDTWSAYQTFSRADGVAVPEGAGIKLWSPGQTADFWTPDGLPDGITRAMRHSPHPAQRALGLLAYRPRSQANLNRDARVSADAVAAGVSPNEPADGFIGLDRWFQTYVLFPPDFYMPPQNPNPSTILLAWHGGGTTTSGAAANGLPNVQIQVRANDKLTCNIYGGRTTLYKIDNPAGTPDVVYPEPPWAWDDIAAPAATAPPTLSYLESAKNFDLLNNEPIERDKWYKLVVHQHYDWRGEQALAEIWVDGVKRVGPGGENVAMGTNYSGPARVLRPASDPDLMPNLWKEDDGTVQQSRMEQTLYLNTEDPKKATNDGWYDPELWDLHMWTRAVWFAGSAFYNDAADLQPDVPASVAGFPHVSFPDGDMLVRLGDQWVAVA